MGNQASRATVDFRALFECLPGRYAVLDPDFRIIAVSDAYLAATLTDRGEIVGRGIFDVFPDNPDDPMTEGARNLRASLERVRRELVADVMPVQKYDIQRPESEGGGFTKRFWSPAISPILGPDDTLQYLLICVEDITEFVQAGEAAASNRLRADALLARSEAMAVEVFTRNQQVADTSRQLKEANAELARLYERTKELAEAKTQFFAAVSHELRTPLTLIMAPLERQLSSMADDDDRRSDLELVAHNARVLLGHINDLLDATRIEAGGIRLTYSDVDLAALTRRVGELFQGHAASTGTTLAVVTPDGASAQADQEQVRRMLVNLLTNAFAATPAGGTVRLELRRDGGQLVFEVADSGPGITAGDRELIFEPFYRDTLPGARQGRGVGLRIARDLVTLHGGTLTVGEATEGGVLFTASLPVSAPPDAHVGPAVPLTWHPVALSTAGTRHAPTPAPLDDERPLVLVAVDNPALNRVICESITDRYRLHSALAGDEALAAARAHRPDLIIAEAGVPTSGNVELVDALRNDADLAGTAMLVLSSRADDTGRLNLLRPGANDYLMKPFAIDELRARATNLIMLRQAGEHLRELGLREDRDRIARDLHDVIIQRLFALGMRLDAIRPAATQPVVQKRIGETVDDLDEAIRDIRATIFNLQRAGHADGLRQRAKALTTEAAHRIGCPPRFAMDGSLDTFVDSAVTSNLLAVLQEALSNTIRHGYASSVDVAIVLSDDELVLTVRDDGVGPHEEPRKTQGHGRANMTARAESLGGHCRIEANTPIGTAVHWAVPVR